MVCVQQERKSSSRSVKIKMKMSPLRAHFCGEGSELMKFDVSTCVFCYSRSAAICGDANRAFDYKTIP